MKKQKKITIEFTPKRIVGMKETKIKTTSVKGKKISTSLWYPHNI